MKSILKYLSFIVVLSFVLTGCSTTKVSDSAEYQVKSYEVKIPNRDSDIPATVVMPIGEGEFPLVVMAHGHGGSREENGGYSDIAEEMAKYGIATIRIDFPGCGESTESFQLNTLSNMMDDVDASIEYAMANYAIDSKRIGIFGYSMGARIALTMATDGKHDFDGLVLLAPAVDDMTMVNFLGGRDAWDRFYKEAQKSGFITFTTMWGSTQELSLEWFEDLMVDNLIENASVYSGKALVIFGEDDPVVSPLVSKATAGSLSAPILDVSGDSHSYSFYNDKPEIRSAIINGMIETFRSAFN